MGPKGFPARMGEEVIELVIAGKTLPEGRQKAIDVDPGPIAPSDMKTPQVIGQRNPLDLQGLPAGFLRADQDVELVEVPPGPGFLQSPIRQAFRRAGEASAGGIPFRNPFGLRGHRPSLKARRRPASGQGRPPRGTGVSACTKVPRLRPNSRVPRAGNGFASRP